MEFQSFLSIYRKTCRPLHVALHGNFRWKLHIFHKKIHQLPSIYLIITFWPKNWNLTTENNRIIAIFMIFQQNVSAITFFIVYACDGSQSIDSRKFLFKLFCIQSNFIGEEKKASETNYKKIKRQKVNRVGHYMLWL